MTAPERLCGMTQGTLYNSDPVPGLPDCRVYIIAKNKYFYALGLQMAYSVGLDDKSYELMVLVWEPGRLIPANIMKQCAGDTHWQVRFFNVPVAEATVTLPQLAAF